MSTRAWKKEIVYLIAGLAIGFGVGTFMPQKETIYVKENTPDTPAARTSVNLMIDYGDGTIRTWNTVSWHEAMSVMDLLAQVAAAGEIAIEPTTADAKEYGAAAIDGIRNDPEAGRAWRYWVNNTLEPRIASKYFLKPGDIVVWAYTKEGSAP